MGGYDSGRLHAALAIGFFASSLFLVTSSLSLARVSAGAPGDFFAGLP
jgi:hypothetical protein